MRRPLRCRADGSFTIVQFTDTHFGNGEAEDDRTAALMERVLDLEQPDLVVFTGDVLGGQGGTRNARAAWARATAPLVARDLRWCAVFGNHDDECDASRAELLAIQQQIPGCLTRPGPARVSGTANYCLRLHSSIGRAPAALLCCLDSNSYAETAVGGYGWVRDDQIRWLSRTLRAQAGVAGAWPPAHPPARVQRSSRALPGGKERTGLLPAPEHRPVRRPAPGRQRPRRVRRPRPLKRLRRHPARHPSLLRAGHRLQQLRSGGFPPRRPGHPSARGRTRLHHLAAPGRRQPHRPPRRLSAAHPRFSLTPARRTHHSALSPAGQKDRRPGPAPHTCPVRESVPGRPRESGRRCGWWPAGGRSPGWCGPA